MENNKTLAKALKRYKNIEFFIDWICNKKDDNGDIIDIVYYPKEDRDKLICEFLDIDYEEIKKVEKVMKEIEEQLAKLSDPGE